MKLSKIIAYDTDVSSRDYSDFRKEKFSKLFRSISGFVDFRKKIILDVGCGRAESSILLKEMGAGHIVSIDRNPLKLEEARRNGCSTCLVAAHAAQNLPFKRTDLFDVTICLDSLEHERFPIEYLKKMIQYTKPGGTIVIEFSHFNSVIGHNLIRITRVPVHLLPERLMQYIVKHKIKKKAC